MPPPDDIIIPPPWMSLGRRVTLHALRAMPVAQWLAFKAYNRLIKDIRQHRRAQTFFGASIDCDLKDLIMMCIFHFGVWEPHISALIQSRLRPGDVFCDVGANIGYHSLLASRSVGKSGRVVAIEPSPSIFERLVNNVQLNNASNVRPVEAAVTAAAGTVSLYRGAPRNIGMTTTVRDHGFGKECDVVGRPLRDILLKEERERLRLVKIDVEGGELAILNDLLDKLDLRSYETEVLVEISVDEVRTDYATEISDVFQRFFDLGYKAYSIENSYDVLDAYLNFKRIMPPRRTELPIREQQDVLFSRSSDLAREFAMSQNVPDAARTESVTTSPRKA